MTEKLCKVCGKIPTNHPSGTCIMCMTSGALPPQASQRELQSGKNSEFKIQDLNMTAKEGGCMAVPKDRQCKREGCEKYAFKGGMCLKDYNEAHGIEKRRGRGISEKNPGKLAKEKICIDCKEPYKPTSNAQERCLKCKEKHLTKKQSSNPNKPHTSAAVENKKITPVIPAASEFCSIRQEDKEVPHEDNGSYIIAVDFTAYPKLHEKLIQLADEDFRNPGQQLLSMLHNTLKDAEART